MPENPRIEELRRRVQADPASIAFAALAEEFRRMGRYDDAIKTCRTGLVRHPSYLSARVTLGRALLETGDFDAARQELETVLRSAPENIAATKGLADIAERRGQSAGMAPEISAIAEKAQERAPDRPQPSPKPSPKPSAPHHAPMLDLPLAAPPLSAGHADEAFDIFEAALQRTLSGAGQPAAASAAASAAPEPAPKAEPPAAVVEVATAAVEAPAPAVEAAAPLVVETPPIVFESATIAFEAPTFAPPSAIASVGEPAFAAPSAIASVGESDASVDKPDPHVAARLTRLEQFLGAIQTARRA